MNVLQVKKYHEEVATIKKQQALNRWRAKNDGYGYSIDSMFYFTLTDRKGYPLENRVKGYIAFNETKAVFGMNKAEAIKEFNRY